MICAKLCPLGRGSLGDTWRFSQTCSRRFADLLMKPRLSRAPIPEDPKGEPIPRSLNCLKVRPCAKLCYDLPEVAVIGLLYVRLTGIAQLDMRVGRALGGGFQAELLYMLRLG